MHNRHINILKELVDSCSISGYTSEAADIYLREVTKLNLRAGRDVLGSVSAYLPAQVRMKGSKNVLVMAHLDTVGYLVQELKKTHVKLAKVGSPSLDYEHPGIIQTVHGKIPITIVDGGEEEDYAEGRLRLLSDLDRVTIGDAVYYKNDTVDRPQGKITSAYLDNKAGVITMLIALERLVRKKQNRHNLYFVVTDMEEIGSYGAIAAAEKIRPMFSINIDVFPVDSKRELSVGTIISRGSVYNSVLVDHCTKIAKNKNIPYRYGVVNTDYESDVQSIIGRTGGIACCELNIPCYNMHMPNEVVSKKGIDATAKLLTELCLNAHQITNLVPGG